MSRDSLSTWYISITYNHFLFLVLLNLIFFNFTANQSSKNITLKIRYRKYVFDSLNLDSFNKKPYLLNFYYKPDIGT